MSEMKATFTGIHHYKEPLLLSHIHVAEGKVQRRLLETSDYVRRGEYFDESRKSLHYAKSVHWLTFWIFMELRLRWK
jgi:hypothetical protein